MKQMEVTILGQSYVLGCPEGGEASLRQAVAEVDREMSAIRDAGKVKARERIAVLAALNLGFQLASRAPALPEAPRDPPTASDSDEAGAPDPAAGLVDHLIQRIDQALADDGRLL